MKISCRFCFNNYYKKPISGPEMAMWFPESTSPPVDVNSTATIWCSIEGDPKAKVRRIMEFISEVWKHVTSINLMHPSLERVSQNFS